MLRKYSGLSRLNELQRKGPKKVTPSMNRNKSLLSDAAILRRMEKGSIVIDPFDRRNLSTSSYDIRLGKWYWREQDPEGGVTIFNPYDKEDVTRVWGSKPHLAESVKVFTERTGIILDDISSDAQVIWIEGGETILCHTNEFIGGCNGIVTTMMKARSSWGRCFIAVCKCAGWGDVGFTSRWTMEVTNFSHYYKIPLLVGIRMAQIVFFEVDPILDTSGGGYTKDGKYQSESDLEALKRNWKPEMMLPMLYKDREIRKMN